MRKLTALILSDGRPGHYHLAEGVVAAMARLRPLEIVRLEIRRRRVAPGRVMARMLARNAPPALVLRAGYSVRASDLPAADLVVSAGGETIAANVAAARVLVAANIYCGTLKHVPPSAMSLVVTSYAGHAGRDRHIVTLKPNGMDPDTLTSATPSGSYGPDHAPAVTGLLVGGDSGLFHYTSDEWQRLLAFVSAQHAAHGTRWIISTSRRTDDTTAYAIAELAGKADGPVAEFIDFRTAGPGTLPGLFAKSEAILCTEDSSTMISEAVCARRPVLAVAPVQHDFKPDEREYRAFMRDNDWARFMPLAKLTPERFLAALAEVRPLQENHLDRLADLLAERLPGLFES